MSKDSLRKIVNLAGEFMGTTDTQTGTNKTFDVSLNTFKQTTPHAGDILKDDGTKLSILARGAAGKPFRSNDAGTDTEFNTLGVPGGGTGVATLSAGVVISAGTSAFTSKANPTGAFLGDSDVQNVTGAKTFLEGTFKLRNPANSKTLTFSNPAITADLSGEFQEPASYLVYIAGSNKKRMNLATRAVEDTNTDASIVLQGVIDACGNTSGKKIYLNAGFYSIATTLNLTNIDGFITIEGESAFGISQLRPTGNFPIITIDGKRFTNLNNLYITHNQVGYTNALVEIKNGSTSNSINSCSFYDFANNVGTAIKLDCQTASMYKNAVNDCHFDGFDIQVQANVGSSSFFCNSNWFTRNRFWNYNTNVFKVTSVSGSAFDSNNFNLCHAQTRTASSGHAFDYDSAHVGRSLYTNHIGNMVWDLPAASNYANVNGTTEIAMLGCMPDYKIGGAGAGNGKIIRIGNYSLHQGEATFSGNSSTKIFTVSHGLPTTPTHVILEPSTNDALGNTYISNRTSTTFDVNYPVAPPTGSSNVKFYWKASMT